MKRYFIAGMVLILLIAVSIVGYGAYLNYRGENQITRRMADKRLPLRGSYAVMRDIYPAYERSSATFTSDRMTDMTALANGRVQRIFVKKNQHVMPGDPIMEIVDDEMDVKMKQADSAVLREEASYTRARNSFARYQQLISMNAVSHEKYDEAEANFRAASASLEEARARKEQLLVQAAHQIVRAEVEGDVLMIYKQQGAYVQAGVPVAMVGDFRQLSFVLNIHDNVAGLVSVGQQLDMQVSGLESDVKKVYDTNYRSGNEGGSQHFTATIAEITPDMSQPAVMRQIRFVVDNSSGVLEPQTYTNLSFRSGQARTCLTIPLKAIANLDAPSVFVSRGDGTIERREIVIGDDDDNYVEVVEGLSEGELVISSNTADLEDGMPVDITIEE